MLLFLWKTFYIRNSNKSEKGTINLNLYSCLVDKQSQCLTVTRGNRLSRFWSSPFQWTYDHKNSEYPGNVRWWHLRNRCFANLPNQMGTHFVWLISEWFFFFLLNEVLNYSKFVSVLEERQRKTPEEWLSQRRKQFQIPRLKADLNFLRENGSW